MTDENLPGPQDAFKFWTENAQLVWQKNNISIYRLDGEEYLFIGQTMYASTTERDWYIRYLMPRAKGKVLELGLGLGVASKVLLFTPGVTSVTTVELSEDVIEAFGRPLRNHKIVEADAHQFVNLMAELGPQYDFIFIDHYAYYEEELLPYFQYFVEECKKILRPEGKIVVWYDENLPESDQKDLRSLWVE